ncbi:heterokaryon incompatibility protein-domain-containing protein [Microdochium trichocladiopsis]|uniref:Heterokaryon incompatibility protein-domain-containing protein n=1 Tax=Microdochium trichocladiopsis TaxID=1682393 RepID=A0A9P8XSD9_9PEZI|nr:heterokaryon incompatibility protein-domain-containing protein [Microdochium trichocladiopsis]KAH7009204.1 heterokaryon incompatibility protein-domain-containing protein [Microdochium trichocladiopsis]
MPHRLIHTGLGLDTPNNGVKLVDTRVSQGKYAALSHCWGKKQPLRTTRSTLDNHLRHIPWTAIPRTFQDAIGTARVIGLEYIWIDSLCIVQDDAKDWEVESSQMMDIYSNAHLTIAATWGTGSHTGCTLQTKPTVYARPLVYHDVSELPLNTRGWVLQEQLLSRRVLYFTPTELRFECRTRETCECRLGSCTEGNQIGPPTQPRRYSPSWHRLVEEYTGRLLTFQSDKLIAISGIARKLEDNADRRNIQIGHYVAGLWRLTFFLDLLWKADTKTSSMTQHSNTYRAPSWSWASMDGPVRYDAWWWSCARAETVAVDLLHCHIEPSGADHFGNVRDGFIRIRGMVTEVTLRNKTAVKDVTQHDGPEPIVAWSGATFTRACLVAMQRVLRHPVDSSEGCASC